MTLDSHFEPGGDWLAPYPELAVRLPKLDPALLWANLGGDVTLLRWSAARTDTWRR